MSKLSHDAIFCVFMTWALCGSAFQNPNPPRWSGVETTVAAALFALGFATARFTRWWDARQKRGRAT